MPDISKEHVDFWSRNGKTFVAVALVLAGLAYVLSQINPETIARQQADEAHEVLWRDIYSCINRMAHMNKTAIDALECLEKSE